MVNKVMGIILHISNFFTTPASLTGYIPKGKFRSLHYSEEIIQGPTYFEDYPAPLDIIPAFEKIE